jgi:hypothetical protein
MSKKQSIEEQQIADAATDALAEEILNIQTELEHERSERKAIEAQLEALREALNAVTNSVQITPTPPAPLERPVVMLDDGTRLRFICGAFKYNGERVLATDVANDPALIAAVLAKFPGLFEPA